MNNDNMITFKNTIKSAMKSFTKKGGCEVFFPIVDNKKYFLKIVDDKCNRDDTLKNEIDMIKKLSKFIDFYKKYYILSMKHHTKRALVLRYLDGVDLSRLYKSTISFSEDVIRELYIRLLIKIKKFHDHHFTHGDIKPGNIILLYKTNDVEYIDLESVNDFSLPRTERKGFYTMHTPIYDFPLIRVRTEVDDYQYEYSHPDFNFYKFLDIYCISISMLYIYNKKIHTLITENFKKNKKSNKRKDCWMFNDTLYLPGDFIDKNANLLEKGLDYVFSYLSFLRDYKSNIAPRFTPQQIPDIDTLLDILSNKI